MELRVNEVSIPERISWNYEELKQELAAKVKTYETMVYTEDEIKDAKADKANLGKLKKALNDERIRREKEYMKPFNEFKAQVNEIIAIIDKPIAVIDSQVKEYEEKRKAEKETEIKNLFNLLEIPEGIEPRMLFNPKWLNATVSMKQVQAELEEKLVGIKADLEELEQLEEFSFEAVLKYRATLDIRSALAEARRLTEIKRLKEERERQEAARRAETAQKPSEEITGTNIPPVEEKPLEAAQERKQWVTFEALITVSQAFELKAFFERNGIEFRATRQKGGK